MSAGRLRKIVRTPHFWLIGPIMGLITIIHYFYFIGTALGLRNLPVSLLSEPTERMLYLLAVAYAGFAFGVVGGIASLVASVVLMLPISLILSPTRKEALLEIGGIVLVGLVLLWWISLHQKERRRAEHALAELEVAHEKLGGQLQILTDSERRSTALSVVSSVVNQPLDISEVRDTIVEKIVGSMGADAGWVYVVEEGTSNMTCPVQRGLSPQTVEQFGHIKVGEGLDGKVVVSGRSVLLTDREQSSGFSGGMADAEGFRSVMVAPLTSKGQTLGTVAVGAHRDGTRFNLEDKALLDAIGSQIGVSIDNMRLFRKEQERRRQSAALSAVSSIVNRSLELKQVLDNALEKVLEVITVDMGWVYLVEEAHGEVVFAAQRGMSNEAAAILDRVKLGEGLNGRVAESGEALLLQDFANDRSRVSRVAEREDLRTILIVPLRSRNKVVGTIGIGMKVQRVFTVEEVSLLGAIGDQIGIAIENARLYQKEREIGQQLRESEENYRDLFENASDPIFVHELQGNIISANKALQRLSGYTQQELCTMRVGNLLTSESLSKLKEVEARQLSGEDRDASYELQLVKSGGSSAIIEMATRLITSGGHPVGFQNIARDVTEQKRRQATLNFYIRGVTRAQEEERMRLARELHDDTAQELVALSRSLDDVMSGTRDVPPGISGRLEKLRQKTNDILEGVRRYSQDLRPSIVDDLGLLPALEWLTSEISKQHNIAANVQVVGEEQRLAPESELALFRIAQEALTNVRKHAQATEARIMVAFGDGRVKLTVSDNGRGFEQAQSIGDLPGRGKLGLVGMQERARLVGGNLNIESQPGKGTVVQVEIPVELRKIYPEELNLPAARANEFSLDNLFTDTLT